MRNCTKRREEKIVRIPESGCWIWTGAVNAKGYGIHSDGLVHRHMYKMFKGDVRDGLYVLHKCDVRCCCNPDHLYTGTQKDNMRDMFARGRTGNRRGQPAGEKHSMARLTEEAIDEIRECAKLGYSSTFLAGCYGITPSHALKIIKNQRWQRKITGISPENPHRTAA